MPEWKASVRRLNSWNESAVPRNRHQRPVFSVPVPFPAGWPCFVQNGKWTLSELSQFLHAGIDSAAFEIPPDFPLFLSMPHLHKHRRTATPIADLCRQRMEHGILSAGHSGVGCRPFQQERLFLWKCNFLYHSCRDNLPLSDDILPYDRAGVKEYTAQR